MQNCFATAYVAGMYVNYHIGHGRRIDVNLSQWRMHESVRQAISMAEEMRSSPAAERAAAMAVLYWLGGSGDVTHAAAHWLSWQLQRLEAERTAA